MQMSEQINEIATALAKAQAELKAASKDAENPHFKSKYADIASIIEALKPLSKHGLAFAQFPETAEEGIIVSTLLMHTSGQWLRTDVPIPVSKADAQGYGSAITYGRRYGLQALCGLAADDDDGNAAAGAATGGAVKRKYIEPPKRKPPEAQKDEESSKPFDWGKIETMPQLVSTYNALSADGKKQHADAFKARREQLLPKEDA